MYLRSHRSTDLELLHAMDAACFEPPFRFSRAYLARMLTTRGSITRVACATEGKGAEVILGFAIAHLQGIGSMHTAYIVTLDVDPGSRKQGVGRTLMSAIEDAASEAGALLVWLHVYTQNAAAIALYEARTYLRVGSELNFYGPGLDAWVYRKDLQ